MSFSILSGPIPSHRTSFRGVTSPFGLFSLNSSGKEPWRKRMRSGVEDDAGESSPAAEHKQEIKQEEKEENVNSDEHDEFLRYLYEDDEQEEPQAETEQAETNQDNAWKWPVFNLSPHQEAVLVGSLIDAKKAHKKNRRNNRRNKKNE